MLPTMDQADTQACQNHHFGVRFPPPHFHFHFQVSAIHYKSMTQTSEEISTLYPIRMKLKSHCPMDEIDLTLHRVKV